MKKVVEVSGYGFILKVPSWRLPREKEKPGILREDCRCPGSKFKGTHLDKSEAYRMRHLAPVPLRTYSLLFISHLKTFPIQISGLDKIIISCCLLFCYFGKFP
jgi:hypothetical protein